MTDEETGQREPVMKSERILNKNKNWVAAALCVVLMLLCAGSAMAYPVIDSSRAVSLTVSAKNDQTAISGLRFTLFKAANMVSASDTDVQFTLTEAFETYADEIDVNLDPQNMDSSAWAEGALTLAPYVLKDAAAGTKSFESTSAVTDESGSAAFTGIGQGLYLMTSSYEGSAYDSVTVTPIFLTLPQLSEDMTAWNYDVSATAKVTAATQAAQKTSVSVRKVWSGDDTTGTTSRRQDSVTVNLLDGTGAVADTQTLSASNGWTFTWTGLAAGDWSVTEASIPDGYSVSQTSETTTDGKAVTITNTTPPTGVQGISREKTSTTEKSTEKIKGSSRSEAGVASESRLPQTGQLWWPIWILAGLAAALVIIGLILRLSGKRDLRD